MKFIEISANSCNMQGFYDSKNPTITLLLNTDLIAAIDKDKVYLKSGSDMIKLSNDLYVANIKLTKSFEQN